MVKPDLDSCMKKRRKVGGRGRKKFTCDVCLIFGIAVGVYIAVFAKHRYRSNFHMIAKKPRTAKARTKEAQSKSALASRRSQYSN